MPDEKTISLKSKKFQRTELKIEILLTILQYIQKFFKLHSE